MSTGQGDPAKSATLTEDSTLAPYPDLTVTGLAVAPPRASSPATALTVAWSDANAGNAAGQPGRSRITS